MNLQFELDMICEFASQDKDRMFINTVSFDDIGLAVSTDGYRLFASKNIFQSEKAGKVFDISELINNKSYKEVNEKFLNWKSMFAHINRTDYKSSFSIEIPEWFLQFKNNTERLLFTIDYKNFENPKIICGDFQNDYSFAIDGRFLAPFAGKTISFHVDNYKTPILVTEKTNLLHDGVELLQELKEMDWFAIIMPIKIEPSEISAKKNLFV
jgi:hypothetical protein